MAYRPTEKTEARKKSQHQLLLRSALTVVSRGGFNALTIMAVAEEAKVATGTVYRYFDSKTALCAEIFRLASAREVQKVKEAAFPESFSSCKQHLLDAIATFADRAIQGHRFAYALIAEPVGPVIEAERLIYRKQYAEIFGALITEGIQTREFRPQNSAISASALVGALAETLVGPLGLGASELAGYDQQQLIRSIQSFCLNAVISSAQA